VDNTGITLVELLESKGIIDSIENICQKFKILLSHVKADKNFESLIPVYDWLEKWIVSLFENLCRIDLCCIYLIIYCYFRSKIN